MATETEDRIRGICLALPQVTERQSHGAPAFFVKSQFLQLWIDGHHEHHFPHLWCAAPPGAQADLVESDGDRYFQPPYVGHRGWVGLRLDGHLDWGEIETLCEDAYRVVAPQSLVRQLDARANEAHEAW